MVNQLLQDERGYVVSAEAVIIATILILGMIVGLSSIQQAIVQELNDVADAAGTVNQSFFISGFSGQKRDGTTNASYTRGSAALDTEDDCDDDQCEIGCDVPVGEGAKNL